MTNWAAYDAALRQRGRLTLWFTEEAIAAWRAEPRTTPGHAGRATALLRPGDHDGADVARCLWLGAAPDRGAHRLHRATARARPAGARPLHPWPACQEAVAAGQGARDRRADPPLGDSTGLKRCGPGEGLIEKHGTRKRRSWSKLHIGVDAVSGQIVAASVTDRAVDDAAQLGPLLDQVTSPVCAVIGDGAYDRTEVYAAVHERHPDAQVVAPPRAGAVLSDTAATAPTPRDQHLQAMAEKGRLGWHKQSGDNRRAMVEGQIGRFKQVIGPRLRFQTAEAQATEIAIAVEVLNRKLDRGRPNSVRVA